MSAAIDTLIADAARLGIELRGSDAGELCLYYAGDGAHPEFPPPEGWRQLLAAEADRIGWRFPYTHSGE